MAAERIESLTGGANGFLEALLKLKVVEFGNSRYFPQAQRVSVDSEPQPAFGKQFEMLTADLERHAEEGYQIYITVSNGQQQRRLEKIFEDRLSVAMLDFQLSHGFIDRSHKFLCYTDHEIFERYHKYTVRTPNAGREAMTLKELFELQPGDYVTHIDYGVGRFIGRWVLHKFTTEQWPSVNR